MPPEWFRRMADIPGLDYEPSVAIDRTKLARHDAVPELQSYEFDGQVQESLRWGYVDDGEEWSTSASPAHEVAFGVIDDDLATSTVLTRLWEGLELPGEATDYHFAIQGAAGALWGRRREGPEVLEWVEWLSWLDIRLVQVYPRAVYYEDPGRQGYYGVTAFNTLITLYEREGLLHEALRVAGIAGEYEQGGPQAEELAGRLAKLRVEDEH